MIFVVNVVKDENIIYEVLNIIKQKRKGQYLENMMPILGSYGWKEDKAVDVLESMISKDLLKKVIVNDKISFRYVNDLKSTNSDVTKLDESAVESFDVNVSPCSPEILENVQNTIDTEKIIDLKNQQMKEEILSEVKSLIFEGFERENYLKHQNKMLEDSNQFLRNQLTEVTGFLDVLVKCFERQNFLHNKSHDVINCQKLAKNNSDISDKHDESLVHTNVKSDDGNNDELRVSVMKQLKDVRKSFHDKFNQQKKAINNNTKDKFKKPEGTIKNRLEKIANYNDNSKLQVHKHSDKTHETTEHFPENDKIISTCILGDSLVKDVKGWKFKEKINKNEKIIVKSFSGATTNCMRHHLLPTLNTNPNHVIIHAGTNDLSSNKTASEIADDVIELAVLSSKQVKDTIAISSLVIRDDKWSKKAKDVNKCLVSLCSQRNIGFLNNDNINKVHLNNSKIHLNKSGVKLLSKNFLQFIMKK